MQWVMTSHESEGGQVAKRSSVWLQAGELLQFFLQVQRASWSSGC